MIYDEYWHGQERSSRFRFALFGSILLHAVVAAAFFLMPTPRPEPPQMIAAEFTMLPADRIAEEPVAEAAPEPPKPKPEPKVEPPKPEPPKKEEPKPEPPKKEEPKPEIPKKEEPKPEPPKKEEPKPKPEPPKEKPKPEPPKEKPKPEIIEPEIMEPDVMEPPIEPPKETPKKEPAAAPKQTSSIQKNALPSVLNSWGRLVQRKVEKFWTVPGGVNLDKDGAEAVISFWVDRNGNILGKPEIVKTPDRALAESGVRAILLAAPLPPLPSEYQAEEQQVVYVFSLKE